MNTTTKVTKLTGHQVAAIVNGQPENLATVAVGKTFAIFVGTAQEAVKDVKAYQEKLAAKSGRQGGDYQALHAVVRKLETGKDTLTTTAQDGTVVAETEHHEAPAPKLTLVADSTDPESMVKIPGLGIEVPANPKGVFGKSVDQAVAEEKARRTTKKADAAPAKAPKGEKAASAKKETPAKKTAGKRTIPTEAANKVRQAWIKENGMELYQRQYNGGWDNATYGTGAPKAASGEATPAWMDGYTDRKANPGKEGIAAKWSALRATTAPVKKVAAEKE